MDSSSSSSRRLPEENRPSKLYGSACDSCRRRRVKCDGNQPCDRCLKSDVSCTYGSLSNRTSAVSYARHLEQKVAELQRLLHLQPSEMDSASSSDVVTEAREAARAKLVDMFIGPGDDFVYRLPHSDSNVFYGRFGGLGTIHKLGNNLLRSTHDPSMQHFGRTLVQTFETCSLTPASPSTIRILSMLPPKSQVLSLSERAAKMALICHECLDHQDYVQRLERLYNTDPEDYSISDRSFLALVYVMIALGKRFAPMSEQEEVDENSEKVQFKGLAYFSASCETFNLVEASDLNAIRAVICQARYLSSMSMISKAYSQVCIGVAIAMRLGMHASSQAMEAEFSEEELFERRKVFATLNMMDIYYSSVLGVPVILKDADPSQILGLPQSDFEDEGCSFIAQNAESSLAQTVMCQKINLIMAKICENRRFLGKRPLQAIGERYEESTEGIVDREAEIEEWYQSLPALPTETLDPASLSAHLTLRLWHALVQIVLYRPFLHHLGRNRDEPLFSMLGFEYASKCVQAAMEVILTIEVFRKYDVLHEGSWLYTYMLEFAVSILLFFVSSSPLSATVQESQIAAIRARDLLGYVAKYNLSARKYFISLNEVLETWSDTGLEGV